MRIIYIVSTLKRCGPTNQLLNIIKHLDNNEFDPIVVTLSPESDDSMMSEFIKHGYDVLSLNAGRVSGIILCPWKLRKLAKKIKPDVIHTNGFRADLLSSIILSKYKRIATLRGYIFLDYSMTYGKIIGRIMAGIHARILLRIDRPLSCSKAVSEMHWKNNGVSTGYIRNGVDTSLYFPPTLSEKQALRRKLNIPLDSKVFVVVGHIIMRKDPLTIIEALKSMKTKSLNLLFLGEGDLLNRCKREADGSPNIKLLGRVENVRDYLKAADYLILASHAEGMPNAVMEAMATSLPCILSDIPQHKEMLELGPDAGELFKTGNPESLVNAIENIVARDYERSSYSALNLVNSHLTAEIMSKNYQRAYHELCSN